MSWLQKFVAWSLLVALLATGWTSLRLWKKIRDAKNNTPDGEELYEMLLNQKNRTTKVLGEGSKEPLAVLWSWGGEYISLEDINPKFLYTLIASEDERFWQHQGIDRQAVFGILKDAILYRKLRWWSSIPSQIFKEKWDPTSSKRDRFDQKIKEWVQAEKLIGLDEDEVKWFILEYYLNTVFFHPQRPGIQAAAKLWFGKNQDDLDRDEIAMIIQAAQNPSLRNPLSDIATRRENAEKGTDLVLQKLITMLREQKFPDFFMDRYASVAPRESMLAVLKRENTLDKVKFWKSRRIPWENIIPYLSDAIIRASDQEVRAFIRETGNDLGLVTSVGDTMSIENQGFTIHTTLHAGVQKWVNSLVQEYAKKLLAKWPNKPETFHLSVLIIDNITGAVVADVSGHDFYTSPLNFRLATTELGSVVKPVVLGAAFELWIVDQGDTYVDQPYTLLWDDYAGITHADGWTPENYGQWTHATIPLSEAILVDSKNSGIVYLFHRAAALWMAWEFMALVQEKLTLIGISLPDHLRQNPQIALGLCTWNTDQIARLYTAFANNGEMPSELYTLQKIEGKKWLLLYERDSSVFTSKTYLFSPETIAKLQPWLLQKGKNVAGKTNILSKSWTSGSAAQLWLTAVTPKLTMVVRCGGSTPADAWGDNVNATEMLTSLMNETLKILSKNNLYNVHQNFLVREQPVETVPVGDSLPELLPAPLEYE
jgi:membrane peptidoglycan carboxypeptidase